MRVFVDLSSTQATLHVGQHQAYITDAATTVYTDIVLSKDGSPEHQIPWIFPYSISAADNFQAQAS